MKLPLFTLREETEGVTSFHFSNFSPSVTFAVSGTSEGNIRLWDLKKRRICASFSSGDDYGIQEALSLNLKNQIVVQSKVGVIQIWDIKSLKRLISFPTNAFSFAQVKSMSIDNNLNISQDLLLIPLAQQGTIGIFDIRIPCYKSSHINTDRLNDSSFDKFHVQPVIKVNPPNIAKKKIYDFKNNFSTNRTVAEYANQSKNDISQSVNTSTLEDIPLNFGMVQGFTPLQNNNQYGLLVIYEAASVAFWDIRKVNNPLWNFILTKEQEPLQSLAVGNDYFWIASALGSIFGLNFLSKSGSYLPQLNIMRSPPLYNNKSPQYYINHFLNYSNVESFNLNNHILDIQKEKNRFSLIKPIEFSVENFSQKELNEQDISTGIGCLALNHSNTYLLAGCWDNQIRIFDAHSGSLIDALPFHSLPISAVEFSKKENIFATASRDNKIAFWKI